MYSQSAWARCTTIVNCFVFVKQIYQWPFNVFLFWHSLCIFFFFLYVQLKRNRRINRPMCVSVPMVLHYSDFVKLPMWNWCQRLLNVVNSVKYCMDDRYFSSTHIKIFHHLHSSNSKFASTLHETLHSTFQLLTTLKTVSTLMWVSSQQICLIQLLIAIDSSSRIRCSRVDFSSSQRWNLELCNVRISYIYNTNLRKIINDWDLCFWLMLSFENWMTAIAVGVFVSHLVPGYSFPCVMCRPWQPNVTNFSLIQFNYLLKFDTSAT